VVASHAHCRPFLRRAPKIHYLPISLSCHFHDLTLCFRQDYGEEEGYGAEDAVNENDKEVDEDAP
jgi:hypothetical protein